VESRAIKYLQLILNHTVERLSVYRSSIAKYKVFSRLDARAVYLHKTAFGLPGC